MENTTTVHCPYCGEPFIITYDVEHRQQTFIEACAVCCKPATIVLELDDHARVLSLDIRRDDE